MCLTEHICNFGAGYWTENCRAYIFARMLNVSADILALAELRLVGAEEVSSILYRNTSFRMETLAAQGCFHFFPQ